MLDITVAIRAVREVVETARSLGTAIGTARQKAADVHEAKRLLGLVEPSGEAYRSDAVHPLYTPGELHPDNEAALLAASCDLFAQETVHRDTLQVDATDNSLLLFGSPTSEGLSRDVFGYSEIPGQDGLALGGRPLEFQYAWNLDPALAEEGEVKRCVPGKGVVARPPWQISHFRSNGSSSLRPQTDSEGLIAKDYLLVTRMPNFLSRKAQNEGRFLVSFGGAHGTGTRAVSLLFRDRRLMRQVLEALKASHREVSGRLGGVPETYQLLFGVSNIKHTPKGSIPRALELLDAVTMPDEDQIWEHARQSVAPRLERQISDATPPSAT